MKYISEFREQRLTERIAKRIVDIAKRIDREVKLMQVCGTHGMAILRYGIVDLLPPNVKIISGPGCPVCVTPDNYIDKAIAYIRQGFLITTFGDMVRVPGSESTLLQEKSKGGKVKVVYSTMEALNLARSLPEERVIFLGIGFETTAPTIAASISMAKEEGINNYMILSGHKLIPPAMRALVEDKEIAIDGFICPGHVSVITGSRVYEFIARDYHVPCVVTGFEPVDILLGISFLLLQIQKNETRVENEYGRVVSSDGNLIAKSIMNKVFIPGPSEWRGMGVIENSGLVIRKEYSAYDVEARYPVEVTSPKVDRGCRCGDVLRGLIEPPDCPLFNDPCNPSHPVGPCMVSVEGTCNIYYRFWSGRVNRKIKISGKTD